MDGPKEVYNYNLKVGLTYEENVAMRIGCANGCPIFGPFGVEDRPMTLSITIIVDHVSMFEEH